MELPNLANILGTPSEVRFHPGTLAPSQSAARRRIAAEQNRRRQRQRQQPRQPRPIQTPLKDVMPWEPVWPDLLRILPNVPISYQIAYGQCKTSLKKRNDYLVDFKKRMLWLGKGTQKVAPSLPIFPFESQFQELRTWFRKEHLLRNKFNTLLRKWREKRYSKRMLNTEDPSTLCEPEEPIEIYDAKSRGKYVFEASALKRQVDAQLGNSKWMFPEPTVPRNPLTNMEFSLGQLLSLHTQLKAKGYTSWMLEAFAEAKYEIPEFFSVHKTALKLHSLNDLIAHPSDEDLCELLEDFVEDEYAHHKLMQRAKLTTLFWALDKKYADPYIREWHFLYRDYMKKLIVHGNTYYAEHYDQLCDIHKRSRKLLMSPRIASLAEERLATVPKKVTPPPPAPLPRVTVTLNAEDGERIITEISDGSITTIPWSHFLTQIETIIDTLDDVDTPQP